MAARKPSGYGNFWDGARFVGAHVYALEQVLGRRLVGQALHSCDNPPCCNPAHLREGTRLDNAADMVGRGRQAHPRRALTDEQVQDVIASVGVERVPDTAARLGVHAATVMRARAANGVGRSRRASGKIGR